MEVDPIYPRWCLCHKPVEHLSISALHFQHVPMLEARNAGGKEVGMNWCDEQKSPLPARPVSTAGGATSSRRVGTRKKEKTTGQ